MIKKVKSLLLFIFLLLTLSGCATNDMNMNIDAQGNVSLIHTIMADSSEYEAISQYTELKEEDFTYNGYTIERITDKDKIGYKIYKNLGKIGKLGLNNDESINLTEYASQSFKDIYIFKEKKGLFFNKYIAKLEIDLRDMNEATKHLPILQGIVYNIDIQNNNVRRLAAVIDDNAIYNKQINSTFTLNSSFRISDSNADSNKDNLLIWNLSFGKINEINFTVNRINMGTVLITLLCLVVGLIIYLLVYYRNQKMRRFAKVSVKESLDIEYQRDKRAEVRDIRYRTKNKKVDNVVINEMQSINDRIAGGGTALGAYDNIKTIDEISKEFSGGYRSRKPLNLEEQDDPKFKLVSEQVKEHMKEKEVKKENKFISEDEK